MRRHRQRIQTLLHWQSVDASARDELVAQAQHYVANQEHPKQIFFGLIDWCWKQQWVIPAYHELNDIITRSFNATDRQLLETVEHALGPEHVARLETLLQPIQRTSANTTDPPLTSLKTIDQSLRPGDIQRSVEVLDRFRSHYLELREPVEALALSDKAGEYYATWLGLADRQQLMQFTNRHKVYLHVLAFIKHQFYLRQDAAIDVFLKSVTAARSSAKNQVILREQAKKAERNLAIQALRQAHLTTSEFASGVVAIAQAPDVTPNEKYYKIEALVDDFLAQDAPDFAQIEQLDAELAHELTEETYYARLEEQSIKLQRRVATIVKTVEFDVPTPKTPLIAAIAHFKATDGKLGTRPPIAFLTEHERLLVYRNQVLVTPLYKCLLFIHMASAIRSGDLNLRYSYRYRAIQDYLIPQAEWQGDKTTILQQTGLADFADGESTLESLRESLDQKFTSVNEAFLAGENQLMRVNEQGRCAVRTPKTQYDEHKFIATTLSQDGIVPILQVMASVNRVSHFTRGFKHYSNKRSKMKPTAEMFLAGILAKGCNIGIGKLAKISNGMREHQLHNTVNWYFDLDNLRAANTRVIETIKKLALANNYVHHPPTLHSSSDGRKMSVATDCLHANYSFKYFGKDKGVTDYTFIDERHALIHSQVFSAADREAPYVIDGLLDTAVPGGQIHSTDTHGFTEQVFGVTHLLGIAFAPRIKSIDKQRIYGFSARQTYKRKGYALVPSRTINRNLILSHWDDVLRFMATIKTRRTTASQLFKRLSSYAADHPLYRALKEFGRIIKSQFILTYYDDVQLRQQIQKQLNRIEQANNFSKAVFFDRDQTFQVGSLVEQQTATACKLLLQNIIILWNYLSLSKRVIETPDPDQRKQLVDAIQRGSILTWSHVNLRGEYDFTRISANDDEFDMRSIKALKIK